MLKHTEMYIRMKIHAATWSISTILRKYLWPIGVTPRLFWVLELQPSSLELHFTFMHYKINNEHFQDNTEYLKSSSNDNIIYDWMGAIYSSSSTYYQSKIINYINSVTMRSFLNWNHSLDNYLKFFNWKPPFYKTNGCLSLLGIFLLAFLLFPSSQAKMSARRT